MSKNAKQTLKRIQEKYLKSPKKIHIVFTVQSDECEDGVDHFMDPIGCYDNAGIAAVVMGKVSRREPIKGIDYRLLNDFEDAVVISLPLNSTICNNQ